uniref:Uncharacterized protein n=1 Tax=Paramoeba aestuarina TaxID=180227 RepID=A0A7S4NT91_9EUKA
MLSCRRLRWCNVGGKFATSNEPTRNDKNTLIFSTVAGSHFQLSVPRSHNIGHAISMTFCLSSSMTPFQSVRSFGSSCDPHIFSLSMRFSISISMSDCWENEA